MADDPQRQRAGLTVAAMLGTVAVAVVVLWWVRRDRAAIGMRAPSSSISGGWLVALR